MEDNEWIYDGKIFIDGKDIISDANISVADKGLHELLAWPPLKTPPFNDWHEEDGIEADLSAPMLDAREANVKFFADTPEYYVYFLRLLTHQDAPRTASFTFSLPALHRSWRLRLVSSGDLSSLPFFSLRFAEDAPMTGYEYRPPVRPSAALFDVKETDDGRNPIIAERDGRPPLRLSDYGARLVTDPRLFDYLYRWPEEKQNLLRRSAFRPGALYDEGGDLTRKSQDIKLQLLLRADDLAQLWRNYDALLFDLIRPGLRRLAWHDCFYKSCTVEEFLPDGRPWLKISVVFTFTDGGYALDA